MSIGLLILRLVVGWPEAHGAQKFWVAAAAALPAPHSLFEQQLGSGRAGCMPCKPGWPRCSGACSWPPAS
jgi:hypothetical protein